MSPYKEDALDEFDSDEIEEGGDDDLVEEEEEAEDEADDYGDGDSDY